MYSQCNVGDFAVPSVQILLLVKLQVKSEFLQDESYSKTQSWALGTLKVTMISVPILC